MKRIDLYLRKEELVALRATAARSGQTVTELVREVIRDTVLKPAGKGPAAIWNGEPERTSIDHDSIYDQH